MLLQGDGRAGLGSPWRRGEAWVARRGLRRSEGTGAKLRPWLGSGRGVITCCGTLGFSSLGGEGWTNHSGLKSMGSSAL